jgi:phage shock protein A
MNDIDTDIKRRRIETLVKVVATLIIGFFVAPFIFIAIKGLIGLAIAAAVSFILIQFTPYFAAVIANWRLKAIKYEASKNPIETLQNNYNDRIRALGQFRQCILDFAAEIQTFADKLSGFKKTYPDEAPKFDEQYSQMKQLLEIRKQKYIEARASLALYDKEIQKAKAIWDMAQAAAKMNKASGVDTDGFLAKIQVETALDSVQKSLNTAFADLEVSLMDEKGQKPLPTVMVDPKALPNKPADSLDLNIQIKDPVPVPAKNLRH